MANQPKAKKAGKAEPDESMLTATAKVIGTAAGKIAALAGVAETAPAPRAKSVKPAKLQKKNKSRLPRREKKAQKKVAMAKSRA